MYYSEPQIENGSLIEAIAEQVFDLESILFDIDTETKEMALQKRYITFSQGRD